MAKFRKRVFTPVTYVTALIKAVLFLPVGALGYLIPASSRQLREKVMLAITGVNDCRYCSWAHTRLALSNKIDVEEINQLLSGVTGEVKDEKEAIAILYAQSYAEEMMKPSKEASSAFNRAFTGRANLEIRAYIYGIHFANLSGNSFDAMLARFKGRKCEDSLFIVEVISSLISAPILLAIMLKAKSDKPGRFDAL